MNSHYQILNGYSQLRGTVRHWIEQNNTDLIHQSIRNLDLYILDADRANEIGDDPEQLKNLKMLLEDLPGDFKKNLRKTLKNNELL